LLRFGEGAAGGVADFGADPASVARLVDSIVSGDAVDGCDGAGCPPAVTWREAHPTVIPRRKMQARFDKTFSGKLSGWKKLDRRRVARE
jgi:hypothetical protein